MTTEYCIAEQQLARTYRGVPELSWVLPDPDVTIVSVTVGDYGGDSWCDVITLSDARVVLVNVTDGETVACLYASDAAAWDCAPLMQLEEAV